MSNKDKLRVSLHIFLLSLLILFAVFMVIRIMLLWAVYYFDRKMPVTKITQLPEHTRQVKSVQQQMTASTDKITLQPNKTGHLFGLKRISSPAKLDLSHFNNIIEINEDQLYIRIGGKANLLSTLQILNKRGYSLKVVPDMDHLTIGGLYSGIGGGASTFKHGAFYCTVKQIEVITGNGEVVIANQRENRDLFKLMPCSLGSLGYVLSFWLEIQPIHKYVYSETQHYRTYAEYLIAIETAIASDLDFLDGTIFSRNEFVLITGKITNNIDLSLPMYGKSLDIPYYLRVKQGYRGYFRYHDYVYRWDVDGYYSMYADSWEFRLFRQKWFRQLFFHHRLMRESRLREIFKPFVTGMRNGNTQIEADVGDFMIPRAKSKQFFDWYDQEIGLYPLYICPITFTRTSPFLQCDRNAIDFGIGYGVTQNQMDSQTLLRKCMRQTYRLGGDMLKYISVYRSPDEFWSFYPPSLKIEYDMCKQKHDRNNRFFSIADKLTVKNRD
jgi:hypothetical protein